MYKNAYVLISLTCEIFSYLIKITAFGVISRIQFKYLKSDKNEVKFRFHLMFMIHSKIIVGSLEEVELS